MTGDESIASGAGLRAPAARPLTSHSVCAFWLDQQCYGLDAAVVAEVVVVETMIPVPLARAAVLGLFSLRGTPIALVDLAEVLALPRSTRRAGGADDSAADGGLAGHRTRRAADAAGIAVVLRTDAGVVAAIPIDRMHGVLATPSLRLTPRQPGEHAAVLGFATEANRDHVITLLDSFAVLEHLSQLKYR